MSVMVLLEAPVKPGEVSNMKAFLAKMFPETRKYDGCRGINMFFSTEDETNMVLVEHWDSRAHHEKYLAWRTETGDMNKIGGMLAGPPSIRYFNKADA